MLSGSHTAQRSRASSSKRERSARANACNAQDHAPPPSPCAHQGDAAGPRLRVLGTRAVDQRHDHGAPPLEAPQHLRHELQRGDGETQKSRRAAAVDDVDQLWPRKLQSNSTEAATYQSFHLLAALLPGRRRRAADRWQPFAAIDADFGSFDAHHETRTQPDDRRRAREWLGLARLLCDRCLAARDVRQFACALEATTGPVPLVAAGEWGRARDLDYKNVRPTT